MAPGLRGRQHLDRRRVRMHETRTKVLPNSAPSIIPVRRGLKAARSAASSTELCYPEPPRSEPAAPRTPAVILPRTCGRGGREKQTVWLEMGDIVEMQNAQTRRSAELLPPAAGSGMIQSRRRGGGSGGGMLHPRSAPKTNNPPLLPRAS